MSIMENVKYVAIGIIDECRFAGEIGFDEGERDIFLMMYSDVLQKQFPNAEIETDVDSDKETFRFDASISEDKACELQAVVEEVLHKCFLEATENMDVVIDYNPEFE